MRVFACHVVREQLLFVMNSLSVYKTLPFSLPKLHASGEVQTCPMKDLGLRDPDFAHGTQHVPSLWRVHRLLPGGLPQTTAATVSVRNPYYVTSWQGINWGGFLCERREVPV